MASRVSAALYTQTTAATAPHNRRAGGATKPEDRTDVRGRTEPSEADILQSKQARASASTSKQAGIS